VNFLQCPRCDALLEAGVEAGPQRCPACGGAFTVQAAVMEQPNRDAAARLRTGLGFTLLGGLILLGATLLSGLLLGGLLLALLLQGVAPGQEVVEAASPAACSMILPGLTGFVLVLVGSFLALGASGGLPGRNGLACSLASLAVGGMLFLLALVLLVWAGWAAAGRMQAGHIVLPAVLALVGAGAVFFSALCHGLYLNQLARGLGEHTAADSAGQYTLFLASTSIFGLCGMCFMDFLHAGDRGAGLVTRFGLMCLLAGQLGWWCSLLARLRVALSRPTAWAGRVDGPRRPLYTSTGR